jgi:ribosomal protein S18 acetylase RimI-like enzyme
MNSMSRFRAIDLNRDKTALLDFHCRINYESETPYARTVPYAEYREKWLSTSQPKSFLSELAKSMKDNRTIAEILEDRNQTVGYVWVTFTDIPDYGITIAEIMDIAVAPDHQHRGLGTMMMRHAEEQARRQGATFLRSDTGIDNVASQKLHESLGFRAFEYTMKNDCRRLCV